MKESPSTLRKDSETLVFNSAWEAAEGLQHIGINMALSEEEWLKKDLHCVGWTVIGVKSSCAHVDHKFFRVLEGFLIGLG